MRFKVISHQKGDSPTVSVLRLAALQVILTVIALNHAKIGIGARSERLFESNRNPTGYISLTWSCECASESRMRSPANQIIPYLQTL